MFCNKCGKETRTDDIFCSGCGANLGDNTNDVNKYNIADIVDLYGKDRISAIKYLATLSGLKLSECKKLIDDEHNKRKKSNSSSFFEKVKEQSNEINRQKTLEKNKIDKLKEEKIPVCPKCGSTSLTANKKGFGIGKAVIGATTPLGLLGLTAGNIGAKKIVITCLNCGHQFKPGQK